MSMIKPLCVTPSPFPYESWFGYILRISESNASKTPRVMLKYAGLGPNEMNNPPINAIASLSNKSVEQLMDFAPIYSSGKHQLARHLISRFYLDTNHHKVCPQCISDKGYIDARWDLYHYLACETHKAWLEETCRSCRKPFDWMRPGLNKCKCNAIMVRSNLNRVSVEIIEISKVISAVFEGKKLLRSDSDLGIPFEHLSQTSLQTLLGLIHSLGSRNHQIKRLSRSTLPAPDAMEMDYGAAKVMSDWPNNFFTFLEWDGSLSPFNESNVVMRNSVLYHAFFKMNYPWEEVEFLFNHLALYAKLKGLSFEIDEDDEAPYDFRRLNMLTVEELAAELNINLKTLKGEYLQQKLYSSKPIYSTREDLRSAPLTRDKHTLEAIAEALKFPTNVVSSMLSDELQDALHRNRNFRRGMDFDPKAFLKHLQTISFNFYTSDVEIVSLEKVMRSRSVSGRVNFLKAIVNRKVRIYTDKHIGNGIFVDNRDVQKYKNSVDVKADDTLDLKSAAAALGCSVGSLSKILSNGLITSVQLKNGRGVNKADLAKFQENYILLSTVAKSINKTSGTVKSICDLHGIKFVATPMRRNYLPLTIWKKDFEHINSLFNRPH